MKKVTPKFNMKFNNGSFSVNKPYDYNILDEKDSIYNVEIITNQNKKQLFSYEQFQTLFDKI